MVTRLTAFRFDTDRDGVISSRELAQVLRYSTYTQQYYRVNIHIGGKDRYSGTYIFIE